MKLYREEMSGTVHPEFPEYKYDAEMSDNKMAAFTNPEDGHIRVIRWTDLPQGHPGFVERG